MCLQVCWTKRAIIVGFRTHGKSTHFYSFNQKATTRPVQSLPCTLFLVSGVFKEGGVRCDRHSDSPTLHWILDTKLFLAPVDGLVSDAKFFSWLKIVPFSLILCIQTRALNYKRVISQKRQKSGMGCTRCGSGVTRVRGWCHPGRQLRVSLLFFCRKNWRPLLITVYLSISSAVLPLFIFSSKTDDFFAHHCHCYWFHSVYPLGVSLSPHTFFTSPTSFVHYSL